MYRLLPVLALGAALFVAGCSREDAAVPAAPASETATRPVAFNFPDLEGRQRQLQEWQGQVVLLNFWAPWCPPCRREMPALVELQQRYAGDGFTVLGITIDSEANARRFAATLDINFPLLIAEYNGLELARGLGNEAGALPYTVVLDRNGAIAHIHRSEITLEQAEQMVQPLL